MAHPVPDYAQRLHLQHIAFEDAYRSWLSLYLSPERINSVIDIACGDGGWTRLIRQVCPNASLVGTDVDSDYLELARERSPGMDIRHRRFNILDDEWSDEPADVVFCADSFQSISDHAGLIAGMTKLARPGGMVLVTETDNLHDLVVNVPAEASLALHQCEVDCLDETSLRGYRFPTFAVELLRRVGLGTPQVQSHSVDWVGPIAGSRREFLDRHFSDRLDALPGAPSLVRRHYHPDSDEYFAASPNCVVTYRRYFVMAIVDQTSSTPPSSSQPKA